MKDENEKKPYVKPEIKHELELEVNAGSPCVPSIDDILGIPPVC